ncbi:uncharacterized protein [Paramisgurnus dabryanus]|uniref:uncharacterized protein isoform X2 n=1 Tax=Paramisgurnus dabryanus TaxID=90735 RepID=UPI0031F338C7
MVPVLQLFLLLHLIQPITNYVNGNSRSPLSNRLKHDLVSYRAKSQTDAFIKMKDHGLAGNPALEIDRPLLGSFYGKRFMKSNNERNEITNAAHTLSAKPSHTDIRKSRVTFLVSQKKRVKRRPSHTDKLPQDPVQTVEPTSHLTELSTFTNQSINILLLHERETVVESFMDGSVNTDWSTVGSGDVFTPANTDLTVSPTEVDAQYSPHIQMASSVLASGGTADPTVIPILQTSPSASAPANDFQATYKEMGQWDVNKTQLKIVVNSTTDTPRDSSNLTQSSEKTQNKTKGTPTHKNASSGPSRRGPFVFSEKTEGYAEDLSVSYEVFSSVKSSPASPTPVIAKEPCSTVAGPCVLSKNLNHLNNLNSTNGSKLVWADLHRTLSFAWELHVFGSATLFLLLTGGAALGLALAPSILCLQRGELVLTNSLLLVAGAVRAGHLFLDPYGARLLLPPPVIIALYTLSLPLLILAQAALVILTLKEAGVNLLPPAFQRPPLLGVLAILQCTLLLAADLLSPALSPAVPIVLQSLTLTAGLALCLWYLFLALPQLARNHAARAENKSVGDRKVQILARVLAVCALLGALCCLLHIYACLWLYGLLGDWRQYRWGWWLCHFWARLLELAWAFCMLLVSSWVFWRPSRGQICRASRQEGPATETLPSPCQSLNSTNRHTCWAKIVQSLKVRQQRKSESNGNGGSSSGVVVGELPNNWAGQERSGVDISKSLIRNRDQLKDSNHGRNMNSFAGGSAGSLLRLQSLAQPIQRSLSSSLADRDKESVVSLYDFDLRPPTPINLSRSIDEALHREHLLNGGSLFQPLRPPSPPSPSLWMRRNSDPQTLSLSSNEHTLLSESSEGLGRCIPSAVPSRQVTAPPTPTHQGFRWVSEVPVHSSLSCPVSLHPSPSTSCALEPSAENTRLFLTPDIESSQSNNRVGQSYLRVNQQDDSVSSDIIDL